MAPRRNVKISASVEKPVPGKLSKGRTRKTNTLKVPSIITISVPGKTGGLDVPDNEKRVDLNTKIALANEVARSQLSKENIEARINPPPIRKRGRRNLDRGAQFVPNNNITQTADVKVAETTQEPASVKKSNKRAPVQTPASQRVTRKRKADSTENLPNTKQPKKQKNNSTEQLILKEEPLDEDTPLSDDIVKNTNGKLNPDIVTLPMVVIPPKKKRIYRRKSNGTIPPAKELHHKFRKPRINRKKTCNNTPKCQSPIPKASSVIKPSQGSVKNCNTDRVDSCKISPTNSISNLSWTHDISSTTTCITVSSKDYVCFNNKIPIIKLNNINNKITKTPSNIKDKTVTSDDTTSSNIETSCDQSLPQVDCNSVNDVDQLNLSSSSHNSNIVQNENNKTISNKHAHARAAENLLRALEKIDMEFINWIHEPEYVSPDLNKLKDKLYDILNSEFCAITYCRNLQDLSVNSKSDYNNINKLSNKNMSEVEAVVKSVNSEKTGNIGIQNDKNINKVRTKIGVGDLVEKGDVKNRDGEQRMSETIKNKSENEKVAIQRDFIKPSTSGVILGKFAKRDSHISDSEDSFNGDDLPANTKVRSFTAHNPHDDDDALSLFAESITGLESSKLNISMEDRQKGTIEKRMEEYVPEPVQKLSPNYTYRPTKIVEQVKNSNAKIVCEKQNADSTSLNKEPDSNSLINKDSNRAPIVGEDEQDYQQKCLTPAQIHTRNTIKNPLIADIYKLKARASNIIFKGYCYFNLIEKCTSTMYKQPCRYSHNIPDVKEIENKLSALNHETFIREYTLIRRNEHVMCRYGICFVEECAKRQLTRILVEMAYDFVKKGSLIDDAITVNAVEITLMHLNNVDLSECEDLLKMRVCGETLLCEVFMKVMASSQNFSRFKSVFLSLTYFLVHNDRMFNLDVAEQILERMCILPFDESLVRALIQIMRWTNPVIFLNSMIVKFEKLISINNDILAEYVSVKQDINFANIGRRVDIVPMVIPVEKQLYQPMAAPLLVRADQRDQPQLEMREGVPLPPSPDTTHLDIMNKTIEEKTEPKIIRTITGINSKPKSYNGFSPGSSKSEEIVQNPNPRNWRNRSIFKKIDRLSSNNQTTFLRRQQRLVTLRGKNYPHRGAKY